MSPDSTIHCPRHFQRHALRFLKYKESHPLKKSKSKNAYKRDSHSIHRKIEGQGKLHSLVQIRALSPPEVLCLEDHTRSLRQAGTRTSLLSQSANKRQDSETLRT